MRPALPHPPVVPLVAAALCLLVAAHVSPAAEPQPPGGAAAGSPPAAEGPPHMDRPPNIVLIAIDTVRSDHLGCYGYKPAATPNLDRLAAEGVLFEQCYSPASWTLPAFMSLFTGVHAQVHGCTDGMTRLPHGLPTLAEKLHQQGYFCGAIASNPFLSAKYGFGRGFDRYDDYSVFLDAQMGLLAARPGAKAAAPLEELVTSPLVSGEAVALLNRAKRAGRPFFLFIHYFDPHASYVPPAEFLAKFDHDYAGPINGREPIVAPKDPPAGRDLAHLIALYDAEIAHNDHQLGSVLRALDELPAGEQPLTIFLSDHGEAFGEHGMLAHGYNVYREVIAVPMIWRWPGVLPKGRRVAAPVSTLDVLPTLRDLLRLDGLDHAQGASLWPGLRGRPLPPDRVIFSEQANHGPANFDTCAVVTRGDFRLYSHFTGAPDKPGAEFELYNLSKDPAERKDLAGVRAPELPGMQQLLAQTWAECSRRRNLYRSSGSRGGDAPERVDLDERERQRIDGLGYTHDERPAAAGKRN